MHITRLVGLIAAALLGPTGAALAGGAIPLDDVSTPVAKPVRDSNLYLDLYGGMNWINDNALDTADGPGLPVAQTFFLDYDSGFVAGLRLGHRYSDSLRADVELSYRRDEIDELTSPGNIITEGYSFTFTTVALMANGYYDFAPMGRFTPYVGAGVGMASVKTAGSIAPGDSGFDYDASQSAFAAQLRLGATVAVSEKMDMGLEYTHFRAFGLDDNLSADFYDTLQDDYRSDSVSVLLRLRF